MKLSDMEGMVGRSGQLPIEFSSGVLSIAVRVTDVKVSFGNLHAEVEPLYGSGRVWVAARKLELKEAP